MTRKGFTLLELLVVIAITAILLGILIPSLRMARQQTRTVVCRTNLRQFGILYQMYADDNKQSLPAGWNGGSMWMVDLLGYYEGAEDVRLCPSATIFLHTVPDNTPSTFTAWGKYGDPDYFDGWIPPWGQKDQYGSYGVNGWAHNPPDEGVAGTYNITSDKRPLYWRTISAKGAGQVPLMGDCMWDGSEPRESDAPPPNPGEQVAGSGMSDFCIDRHQGWVNMLLLDFSSRKVGLKELWKLTWHAKWNSTLANPQWPEWMREYREY